MAATSGTVYSEYARSSRLYVNWSQTSQSVTGNYTDISWVAGVSIGGGNEWYLNAVKITGVYIGGTKVSNGGTYSNITGNGNHPKLSGTARIDHSSDGTKTFAIEVTGWFYSYGNKSGRAAFTLTTIPRVSDLSLNKTSVPADGTTEITATAAKKSSSFTDTIAVTLGDYSKTVTSGTAFTIPMNWINAISGTSATATVTVTTKSGSTTIGSKTANLTITVPSSVKPTINEIDIAEAVSKVTSSFGSRFVKGLSQLNVAVDADGIYGSTIKSYSTTVDGVNYIQQAFTSNVINAVGELAVKTKVTDSRGRSAELTKNITVIDYMPPVITSIDYYYCDSDGTRNDSAGTNTKVMIAYKAYPVDGQNTKTMKLSYKKVTETAYSERTLTLSNWNGTVETIISNTASDVTYEYIAEITDKITSSQNTVMTGIIALSLLAGGKGARFFGEAENEGVWVDEIDYTLTEGQYDALMTLLDGGVTDEYYTGEYSVTPETYSNVTLETANLMMMDDVIVSQIPQYEVSNDSEGTTLIIGKESL